MTIALFILLSVPIGYLLGGKLKNVPNYTTRVLGLPIAAFMLEAAAPFLRSVITTPISQWHWMIVTGEYLLLFAFCLLNRKSWPIWIIFAACVLNFTVIAIYGFQMPVAPYARDIPEMAAVILKIESGELFRYTIATTTDPLWFLGDVIVIPIRYIGGLASIGDILLGIGSGSLFVTWMMTKKETVDTASSSDPKQEPHAPET